MVKGEEMRKRKVRKVKILNSSVTAYKDLSERIGILGGGAI